MQPGRCLYRARFTVCSHHTLCSRACCHDQIMSSGRSAPPCNLFMYLPRSLTSPSPPDGPCVALLQGQHKHEAYTGDRTREAFEKFADSLVPTAGQPHLKHDDLKEAPKASGCNLAGG